MKIIAYLLAIICVIVAVMYYKVPAGSLPTFMPGYDAKARRIFTTCMPMPPLVAAVVLFGIGWFSGRR